MSHYKNKLTVNDASSRAYVKLPKVNLKNIIIDYKKYIKDFAIHDSKLRFL